MSFDNLKKLGRCVDNKIRKLNKIWETPHNIINNTHAVDKEVQVQVENFLTTISKLHNELNENIIEQKESKNDVDRFINECHDVYNNTIKQGCDSIEIILKEYGYTPLKIFNNESIVSESSILKEEDLQNLSLVDSNNINFNDFSKESNDLNNDDQILENDQENMNIDNELNDDVKPKCIPTPVIQRLASITNRDNRGLRLNNYVTPLRSYPEEPTYSPYYYSKN